MDALYDFLSGPGVWISLIVFCGGLLARACWLLGMSLGKDKVVWNHFSWGWSFRSIGHWLLPWLSVSSRKQPVFTAIVFVFHLCLLGLPLFLEAHNVLWAGAMGWSLWSLPEAWAEGLTIVVMAAAAFFLLRRIVRPEVRVLTSAWDYFLLLLTAAPFVTGFLAYRQVGPYEIMLTLHIGLSELLLVVVPFSKLAHVILFFFSRAHIGSEFGARRGARTW